MYTYNEHGFIVRKIIIVLNGAAFGRVVSNFFIEITFIANLLM
jgi:hypothetical protein